MTEKIDVFLLLMKFDQPVTFDTHAIGSLSPVLSIKKL